MSLRVASASEHRVLPAIVTTVAVNSSLRIYIITIGREADVNLFADFPIEDPAERLVLNAAEPT